jgi:hypothetical protein
LGIRLAPQRHRRWGVCRRAEFVRGLENAT